MPRLLVVALVLLSFAAVVSAAVLVPMPQELNERWLTSLEAKTGWNAPGYDTTGWVPADRDIPGRYPIWMPPEQQVRHTFMWHPAGAHTGKPVYFRRSVYTPGEIARAVMQVRADDQFMLYVNGRGVVQSREAHRDELVDLQAFLHSGTNVIGVQARDVQPSGYGVLVVPRITQRFTMGDGGWSWSLDGGTDWHPVSYDKAPPIEVTGFEPFRCVSLPGGMDEFSTAFFRRTLELDGLPIEAQTVILADDSYELRVNGQLVTLEKRLERSYLPRQVNLLPYLHPGRNTLTVKVTNDWGPGRFYCVPTVTTTF